MKPNLRHHGVKAEAHNGDDLPKDVLVFVKKMKESRRFLENTTNQFLTGIEVSQNGTSTLRQRTSVIAYIPEVDQRDIRDALRR
jgi:hypothetical protein